MISSILTKVVLLALLVVIIVVPVRSLVWLVSDQIRFNFCQNNDESEKLKCQRTAIKQSVKHRNFRLAINLFKRTIKDSPTDCHNLGHEIGRDVYNSLKKKGLIRINDPLSDCGYGFWHGFMSGVTNDIQNGENLKIDLSRVCQNMLGSNTGVYPECYHGFGIGFVGDPPSSDVLGNPDLLVQKATDNCKSITNEPSYLEQCYSGVFHQTLAYMQNREYGFNLPKGDLFYRFCNKFGDVYQKPCLEQLGPIFATVITNDIAKIVSIVNTKFTWVTNELRNDLLRTALSAAVHTSNDIETRKDLILCFSFSESDKHSCFVAVLFGVMGRTREGDAETVKYLVQIVDESSLNDKNKEEFMAYLSGAIKDKVLNRELKTYCKKERSDKICNLLPN